MLRKVLDFHLQLTEEGKRLERFRPLVSALDTFFYEAPIKTTRGPHIRDMIDLKRWMMIVVYALVPCILVAIWNSGVQGFVYGSGSIATFDEYLKASETFGGYFAFGKSHFWPILQKGLIAFLPIMILSYAVGGFWEVLFAIIRRHEVSEGFLVTGMLFALILPSTIPYWMAAVGVSAGVVIGKEIFGGTGMNILNPALVCRAFLFFAFPTKMTGPVWVGTNTTEVGQSIQRMNKEIGEIDGISQASILNRFNISTDIKRVHIDAIGLEYGIVPSTKSVIEHQLKHWKKGVTLTTLTPDERKEFITSPLQNGGLGLSPDNYSDAVRFAEFRFAQGKLTNGNFFFGNRIGSMGETSIIACLLGALLLIYTRIGSWRTMVGVAIGAYFTALLFEWGALHLGPHGGAFNAAKFALPAYKHLLIGSLAFGLVFMATDPVSSPYMRGARWLYGLLIGALVIIIRTINPAYPEGVMLAILLGNVFAPLIDHGALNYRIKKRYGKKKALI
ncbi:MAG: NADH:ubiquinone reductase (Na(+)-transporting) subunit B [Simkaniaceae bacterium]|nr:MAG: NADH:ubiquinone reductase (Na(+)-transporting) subunit B [Simkaniaceae bacterium]